MVRLGFSAFMELMRRLGLLRYRVESAESLEDLCGRLIVANHPCLIDIVFLLSVLPDAVCVVKMGVWNNPFFHGTARGANYIPNDEPKAIIRAGAEHLRAGRNVVLFPEGTRSPPGELLPFRRGAAWMAIEAGRDIDPAWITMTPPALTKGLPWYKIPIDGGTFVLRFLPAMPTQSVVANARSDSSAARELTQRLEDMYHRLVAGE